MNKWNRHEDGKYSVTEEAHELASMEAGVYKVVVIDTMFGERLFFQPLPVHDRGLIKPQKSQVEDIVDTIAKFWKKKELYQALGLMFKRGILLYGKQGGGKTSMLNMIYTQLVKDGGVVLVADHVSYLKMALNEFRAIEPDRHVIVVIEDVDQWANKLNDGTIVDLLDGTVQYPNTVFLATTNYLEKVSNRVKNRPSRFDEVIEVLPPNAEVRAEYFQKLKRDVDVTFDVTRATNDTEGFTFAMMKELFVSVVVLEKDYKLTLNRLKIMDGQAVPDEELYPSPIDFIQEAAAKMMAAPKIPYEEIQF